MVVKISGVNRIEEYAFANSGISGKVILSNQVEVGNNAFINTHIDEIVIYKNSSIDFIDFIDFIYIYNIYDLFQEGKSVFSGCNELKKITIHSNFYDLSLFAGANNITDIEIDEDLDLLYDYPLLYNKK